MFDESGWDNLESVRRKSEGRVRRKRKRGRQHDTRVLILAVLSGAETCLTMEQIRSRIPGPRRPQRHMDYHLRVLVANGLAKQCGDQRAFELP